MKPFDLTSLFLGVSLATALSARSIKRKSLSPSGATAAWFVGFLSIACGLRGLNLIIFYLLGTSATKYKKSIKETKDASASVDSVRGASQVLACSLIAVICSLIHVYFCGEERVIDFKNSYLSSSLACASVAHYACCCGDTLASEMGILSSQKPFLVITPWKSVPPGTNGGITILGTFWSAIGGICIGVGMLLVDSISGIEIYPIDTIVFGFICGLLGSFLDSILGAILQATFYDKDKKLVCSKKTSSSCVQISGYAVLSNVQVNIVSTLITTIVGGFLIGPLIFS